MKYAALLFLGPPLAAPFFFFFPFLAGNTSSHSSIYTTLGAKDKATFITIATNFSSSFLPWYFPSIACGDKSSSRLAVS